MTGDRPAALVPAASDPPALFARAEADSRRHERRLVREVQRGSTEALEEVSDARVAVVGDRVLEVPGQRQLFQGDVDGITWSADGTRLLLSWRAAGQWLLVGPGERIRALDGVTRELGAAGGFPRVVSWCCPR